MASWSDQDVRVNGTSIMSRKFWISDRSGLDASAAFRSTNFEVAYLQGTMWRPKQLAEIVRSIGMTIDSCDADGVYPVGVLNRVGQLNSNRIELLGLFNRENAQIEIQRDVLVAGGTLETWTGYAQAASTILPEIPEDFDSYQTLGVDLLFADPVWYGTANTPSVSGTTTVTNAGTVDATNMVLTFTGGSGYRLTNQTADRWVQIDDSGTIIVDVRAGTATKGGANIIGSLSKDGGREFMALVPGANTMVLTGGGSVQIAYSTPRA